MDTKGKIMITCKEATFLISKDQQDELKSSEWFKLKFHLMMCRYCRRFSVQIAFIHKAIKRMRQRVEKQGVEMHLTDEQKQRMRQKITSQQK